MGEDVDGSATHAEVVDADAAVVTAAGDGVGWHMDVQGGHGVGGFREGLEGFVRVGAGIPEVDGCVGAACIIVSVRLPKAFVEGILG